MKTLSLILAAVGLAVGYNFALVAHGPDLYKAINGPDPVKPAKAIHRHR